MRVGDANKETFCNENKCTVDKNSSTPVDVTLQNDGTFSYTLQAGESLELKQIVGVSVKEPNKFVSCSTTTVKPVTVGKTEVKDPKKLTAEDKKAIDAAIRKAYTVNGVSKLPNGIGDWDGVQAVIQIDDSGNAKIFRGNDVAGDWDPNNDYKFDPETNDDGSVKIKEGAEPKITIPAKDLLKNIKPDEPAVALSGDKKSITITPNLDVDTDAMKITVNYEDPQGNKKEAVAVKRVDNSGEEPKITWEVEKGDITVNKETGVITLEISNIKETTKVTAKVTDNGGLEGDTDKLESSESEFQIIKAIKVEGIGGLEPVDIKKWVGDKIEEGFWKDGVKAKDSATAENKTKIKELLDEAGTKFTDETTPGRKTDAQGDYTGTIKVAFDDGSFIKVEKQMLYVSDIVTSADRENTPEDTVKVQFMLGEGVKVEDKNPNTGEVTKITNGDKDNPVPYKTYKIRKGTDFSTYKYPDLNLTIYQLIDEVPQDGYADPEWKGQDTTKPKNFVASDTNNVFIATATKTYDITFDANSGGGTKDKVTQRVNTDYELPAANTFTPPNDNQEFSGWQIGNDSKNLKKAGDTIKIAGDTRVKAIWKAIEFKVKLQIEAGATGSMDEKTVKKGDSYELPKPTFTPDKGKVFAGWKVGDSTELKKAGDKIDISGDLTQTATWKDKTGTKPGEGVSPGQDKPNKPEEQIPGIKIRDHYTPTFPVYVTVPKTEKVEKAEEVPVSLETHKAYIAGYEDNTLRAEGNLTRAEAAAMVTRLAGLDLSDTSMPAFKDMQKNAWYFRYINAAVKAKMLDADNGMMRPNDKITRAEFAKILAAIDKENSSVSKFDDIKGHRYEKEINKIYGNNRIEGYEDGSFRPDAYLTRAESAAFLNRMFNRIADKEAYAGLEDKLARFKDFDASKWYYDEMVEATNSHELTRRGKASDKFGRVYEKWTRILPSDVK